MANPHPMTSTAATIAAQLDVTDYLHQPFAVERLRALLQCVCT